MLFNSGQFFFFFILIYFLYQVLPHRAQNRLLLIASYYFYAAWDVRFLALIVLSTGIDYVAALAIEKSRAVKQKARMWLSASIAANLGILGFFKYFDFFATNAQALLSALGFSVSPLTLSIILPAGISFYTFQTMSYTIDVFRGRQRAVTSFELFALYVAFFPQLMAGPIERARKLLPQLENPRRVDSAKVKDGCWLILCGVFKKVYIADNLSPYVEWAFARQGAATSLEVYLAIFAFSVQLYCDFSGYSDMARGLGKLLGVELSRNFKLPYWASNPSELWQRWHITLSSWFRDYVYGPLRSRLGARKWHPLALLPTFALIGLWHGAAWKYVVFGMLWGITLLVHRVLWQPYAGAFLDALPSRPVRAVGIVFTQHLWLLFLLFFIAVDTDHAWRLWVALASDFTVPDRFARDAISVAFFALPLFLAQGLEIGLGREDPVSRAPFVLRIGVYIGLLVMLLVNGSEQLTPFIYFQF